MRGQVLVALPVPRQDSSWRGGSRVLIGTQPPRALCHQLPPGETLAGLSNPEDRLCHAALWSPMVQLFAQLPVPSPHGAVGSLLH